MAKNCKAAGDLPQTSLVGFTVLPEVLRIFHFVKIKNALQRQGTSNILWYGNHDKLLVISRNVNKATLLSVAIVL